MKITDKDLNFLKEVEDHGVTFFVNIHPTGSQPLTLSELSAFLQDPCGFSASKYNVSKNAYLEWVDFSYSQERCYAFTKSGNRCENRAKGGSKINHPSYFEENKKDSDFFCGIHQQHMGDIYEFNVYESNLCNKWKRYR